MKDYLRRFNWFAFVCMAALMAVGVFFVYSANASRESVRLQLLYRSQAELALFGILAGFALAATNYRRILSWSGFLYLGAVALLVAIILIVSFIVIRNMRPLYRLTDWLRSRKSTEEIPKPDSRIKVQEFKEIETAVLEASERTKQVFEEQKRFIGNASHEIQTPIAICRNRLELLVDETQLDEHQLTEIEKTLDTLGYISRLNKSLLFLSKIDNHQFKEEAEIEINQVVNQALENLSEIFESMKVGVSVAEKQRITAKMDPTLASSLVTNLLKNAFIHNLQGGNITITLSDNTLIIGNTGKNEVLDPETVFKTFYRKGENTNSTGLGLAIAKAICTEYGFEIRYQFIENQHTFSIKFK